MPPVVPNLRGGPEPPVDSMVVTLYCSCLLWQLWCFTSFMIMVFPLSGCTCLQQRILYFEIKHLAGYERREREGRGAD